MDIDFSVLGQHLLHLLAAFVLTLPVAWDREQASKGPGLRTFPLVAIASCGYVLISLRAYAGHPDAMARVLQGVVSGMGFIGGGAILKHEKEVSGLANAACIWATGAIGAACAFGYYEIALVVSLVSFFTFRYVSVFKNHLNEHDGQNVS